METYSAYENIKRQGDFVVTLSLCIYFVFGIAIAFIYNTFSIALGVGGISLLTYFLIKWLNPTNTLYQYVASGLYAIFTAQFIYQMHGLFEMHFFVFVGAVLLIAYQNWLLQLPNIFIVVVHHATFAYLQYAGNKEIYFTQLDYMDLPTFMIHGGLAALIVLICGYWSYVFKKFTLENAQNTESLNNQLKSVNKNIAFAEEISRGNLVFDYKSADSDDELGKALLRMRENLVEAQQREQQDKFITVGLAKIGEIVRANNQYIEAFGDEVIKFLVHYVNANQAGLFLINQESAPHFLQMVACYAYNRKKYINKKIAIGEGLVGQCFLEKETTYLTEIPKDYMKITSGLGISNPNCLAIVPIKSSEVIVGVLEIASFTQFGEKELVFLEKIGESIASVIISVNINQKTKRLLEESQQNAGQMKAQEEEMRQNLEELEAIQEEVSRKIRNYELLEIEKDKEVEELKNKLSLINDKSGSS